MTGWAQNKTVVVTGAARGIGAALAVRFSAVGANVVIADLSITDAERIAQRIKGFAIACDVTKEADIQSLVAQTECRFGPIDLFCSNAGIAFGEPDTAASASNLHWQTCWDVHVMAHVYAARAVLPGMIERGEGYLVQMASAAGLLSQIGDAAYSASKHAAVGFAESLAITHADDGVKVSLVCPQYVATSMLGYAEDFTISETSGGIDSNGIISTDQVADVVMEGLENGHFLLLPHPQVLGYVQSKSENHDRWIGGMVKLRRKVLRQLGHTRLTEMHKLV